MAFKKDNKIKSNFNRISIGLASPEGQRTTSAIAVNTRESATEVSYATDAAWR